MTYPIGYRRPPASGQFKKGTSGNPKGRPQGSKNLGTVVHHELAQRIVVTENGKKKSITRMQAIAKRLVAGALQGDPKALITLIEILRRTSKLDATEPESLLPPNYQAVLDSYVKSQLLKADVPAASNHTVTDTGSKS